MTHHNDRASDLESLKSGVDLLVIGGGVNGLATAWDASLRGLRVAIVEKGDWGSGTSSWSSRLIHGGLKYLEHLEFGLVFESLRDREWLLRSAPHLVKPLAFLMPFYRTNEHGRLILRLGMFVYDVLSFGKSVPNHRGLSRKATIEREPSLVRDGLQGAGVYYDAQVAHAERLCVELMLAARAAGAITVNYAEVEALLARGSSVAGATVVDRETGERFDVPATVTVNAAGPWIDDVLRGTDMGAVRLNGGTKGTHLVVDRWQGGPTEECVYYEARSDGRQVLVIPWLDRYLIGSTDKRFDGDLDRAMPDEQEVEYILAETNAVFPEARLTRDSIAFAYTGVRPLPYKASGAEGAITRKHIVKVHPQGGLITLIGGKLTTFRTLGEHAADAASRVLGVKQKSRTRTTALPGSAIKPEVALAQVREMRPGLDSAVAIRLVDIYGSRALDVVQLMETDDPHAVITAEVLVAVRHEQARTLSDVLARRTMRGLDNDLGVSVLARVVAVMATELGWSAGRAASERDEYLYYIERLTRTEEGGRLGAVPTGN